MSIPDIRSGDDFLPDLKLSEETPSIGKWGRIHRDCLKEYHPIRFSAWFCPATFGHTLPP